MKNIPDYDGFTLIELLVVTAIIGILASIAIPNFLNARMRSLAARSMADIRNCSVSIENYFIDNNKYPFYNNPVDEVGALSGASITYLPVNLTTPVSYLSCLPNDPFPPKYLDENVIQTTIKPYKYIHGYDQVYKNQFFSGDHIRIHFENHSGRNQTLMWQIWSLGPDRIIAHDGVSYDISNGLMSYGDIIRFGP